MSIELRNVGPIQTLSIPVPDGGGLVVLRGVNGAGKTKALTAIESLYDSGARKALRFSDGVPSGSIEGLGVTVRLGRVNTIRGELLCEGLDGRVDPSRLVDPGLKDPEAADRRRLETLVRLAGIRINSQQWRESLDDDVGDSIALNSLVDESDPVKTADTIRRRLHEAALAKERIAESMIAEAGALRDSLSDVDLSQECDPERLAAMLDRATSDLAALLQRGRDYIAARESQATATTAIEELAASASNVNELETAIGNGERRLESLQEKTQHLESLVEQLAGQLGQAKEVLATARAEQAAAIESLDQQRKQLQAARDQARKLVQLREAAAATLPEPVSLEMIAILQESKANALAAFQQGEVIRRAHGTLAKAERLTTEAEAESTLAEAWRRLARSTDAILEEALVNAGFDAVKVHDGRLCVQSDRGLEPFSELSHGERWRLALDLAARGLQAGAVLPVRQEAFESLDPANRLHLASLAREHGLVIVTAEATGGELRAEIESTEIQQ